MAMVHRQPDARVGLIESRDSPRRLSLGDAGRLRYRVMLSILYADDYLVAVDKPPGLLVHRTGLDAGETRFAMQMLRDQLGRPVWPVHRLDKGTSGVLLFALDTETARAMGQAFESGEGLHKTYRAVVRGWPADEGLIDHPLRRMTDDRHDERDDVQDAVTQYKTIECYDLPLPQGRYPSTRCALMELSPRTGRRHQLRRHMKHLAHPIIGDTTHGKGPLNRDLAAWLSVKRLWLHAQRLELRHPITGEGVCIEALLGPEWGIWPEKGLAGGADAP